MLGCEINYVQNEIRWVQTRFFALIVGISGPELHSMTIYAFQDGRMMKARRIYLDLVNLDTIIVSRISLAAIYLLGFTTF